MKKIFFVVLATITFSHLTQASPVQLKCQDQAKPREFINLTTNDDMSVDYNSFWARGHYAFMGNDSEGHTVNQGRLTGKQSSWSKISTMVATDGVLVLGGPVQIDDEHYYCTK